MGRTTDRADDPSPFAWIFAGALALLDAGTVLASRRTRRQQREAAAAREVEETLEGHPS